MRIIICQTKVKQSIDISRQLCYFYFFCIFRFISLDSAVLMLMVVDQRLFDLEHEG